MPVKIVKVFTKAGRSEYCRLCRSACLVVRIFLSVCMFDLMLWIFLLMFQPSSRGGRRVSYIKRNKKKSSLDFYSRVFLRANVKSLLLRLIGHLQLCSASSSRFDCDPALYFLSHFNNFTMSCSLLIEHYFSFVT